MLLTNAREGPILRKMTKVPVIHIEDGAGIKLVCQHCDHSGSPERVFLSDWRDLRYESARCRGCQKEIAGIVVRKKRGVGPDGQE